MSRIQNHVIIMRRIHNVRLPNPLSPASINTSYSILLDEKDYILDIIPLIPERTTRGEDWQGDWLSPMGIDLQINGGLGITFTELTPEDIPTTLNLLDKLWENGVEGICPTIISCPKENLRTSLDIIKELKNLRKENRSKIIGAHLEGPFLSPEYRGAHPIDYICKPSINELEERINGLEDQVQLMTIAPELPGSSEVIERLNELGVITALGHSSANGKLSRLAFNKGIKMLTHTFNRMQGIHHREPGPIIEALKHGDIFFGLIADGIHVHPDLAVLLQKLSSDKLVLISDALPPYGLETKNYVWEKRVLNINDGACYLNNKTLAGTTLNLLEGCKNLAKWSNEPGAAIFAATVAPRKLINKDFRIKDHFLRNSLGNLLRWQYSSLERHLTWAKAA